MRVEFTGFQLFSQSAICADTRLPQQKMLVQDNGKWNILEAYGSAPASVYRQESLPFGGYNLVHSRENSKFALAVGPEAGPAVQNHLQNRINAGRTEAGREAVGNILGSFIPVVVLNEDKLAIGVKDRPIFELKGDVAKGEMYVSANFLFSSPDLKMDDERAGLFPARVLMYGSHAVFEYLAYPPVDSSGIGIVARVQMAGNSLQDLAGQVQQKIDEGNTDELSMRQVIRPSLRLQHPWDK